MRKMTDKEKKTAAEELDYYDEKFCILDDMEDPCLNCKTHEDMKAYTRDYHYYKNMAEMKKFQLDHDLQLTPDEEECIRKWFCDGFCFKLDFSIHNDEAVPIDKHYGFCIIDYLITDNEAFKDEVDQYRILHLISRHIYSDPRYCGELIESFQTKELNRYLEEHPGGFNEAEIKGCRQWIDDGHAFWENPFGLVDDNGCECNYLSALQHLR